MSEALIRFSHAVSCPAYVHAMPARTVQARGAVKRSGDHGANDFASGACRATKTHGLVEIDAIVDAKKKPWSAAADPCRF